MNTATCAERDGIVPDDEDYCTTVPVVVTGGLAAPGPSLRARLGRAISDAGLLSTRNDRIVVQRDRIAIRRKAAFIKDDYPRLPFVGNGDVYSFNDWEREMKRPGIDSCMLARGVLIKPWLPTEIKGEKAWD